MGNNRVHYPIHYIAAGPFGGDPFSGPSGYTGPSGIHGVQSISMTTTFNLEQVFELGQLDIYENIEDVPDIEMQIEKVLDGYPLIWHMTTRGATSATLLNRSNRRSDIYLSIFADTLDSSTGEPEVQAYCSGMYINSLNYTLPVQGNATESVTLIGNDKIWIASSGASWTGGTGFAFNGEFDGNDSPAAATQRRQHVLMGQSASGSVWPSNLPGLTVVNGSGYNVKGGDDQFGAHIQDVTIATSLGREDLHELGRRRPYYRFANFPTAVDCTINMTAGGDNPGDLIDANADTTNLTDEPIVVHLDDGTKFDLGTKNKLQSVTYSGGDAGGGVVGIAFNFQNFNTLAITHPLDPEGL